MTLEKKVVDVWIQKKYNLIFIATPDTSDRVEKIQKSLTEILSEEVEMQTVPFSKFANTAWNVMIPESVRGKHVYVYADVESNYKAQELLADTNSRYMFIRGILNAARKFGAKTINIIFPMYAYSRSDKWEKIWTEHTEKRTAVYANVVESDMISDGVDYIFTIDIHNPTTLSQYKWWKNEPNAINIPHSRVIQQWLKKMWLIEWYEMWSTDEWWTNKLQKLLKDMKINWYIAFKARDNVKPNTVNDLFIQKWYAEITDKDIVIYDDMIDTAWTLVTAVDKLLVYKPKSITIIATHWLFNWPAIERLQKLYDEKKITWVCITNSVYREWLPSFINIMDTTDILARQIARKSQGKALDPNWWWVEKDN